MTRYNGRNGQTAKFTPPETRYRFGNAYHVAAGQSSVPMHAQRANEHARSPRRLRYAFAMAKAMIKC